MHLSLRLSLVAVATALLCACGNGSHPDGGDARGETSTDGSMNESGLDIIDTVAPDVRDAVTDRGAEIATDAPNDDVSTDGDAADGSEGGACTDLDLDGYGDGPGCLGPDCDDHDANAHPMALEICNNVDDDCNGMVDDGLGTTSCGVGVCRRTVDNCAAGVVQRCTPGMPVAETCNGIDDDCNGMVDEGIADITCGTGACRVTVPGCTAGMVPTCTPGATATETCNGIDDDCDGTIDNGFGAVTCGTGACQRTVSSCSGGTMGMCTPGDPVAETCNNIDDDCNGMVDDGLGMTTCGIGACQRTVQNCVSGRANSCTAGTPASEVCNGIDDNCNGVVDEGFGTMSCGTGACARTVDLCSGGMLQSCVPGTPVPETCNGIDDNCNSATDEGLGATTCGMGTCTRTVSNCVGGSPQMCVPGTPGTETCNGLDDNCNGTVDDGLGSTTCGMGACIRTVPNCVGGVPQMCVATGSMPEVCNAIDDDCDGMIDEMLTQSCYTGPAGTSGVGTCRAGMQTCASGVYGTCTGQTLPATETCNNMDDNCNGAIDDGVTRTCYTGAAGTNGVGVCRGGTQTCTAGAFSATCAGQVVPTTEICNNMDDDCNGAIDNGVTQSCYSGPAGTSGVGACRAGTQTCTTGTFGTCTGQILPVTETCNNVDDNCNGMIDDGVTRTCYTGAAGTNGVGVCRGGTQTCTAGTFSATCTGQVIPTTEICNNMDDDCNGTIDNGVTQSCYTGPVGTNGVGACRAGTQTCTTGTFGSCAGQVVPGTEVCNNIDDNCNGTTDEGVTQSCYTGPAGTSGVGACHGGTQTCSGGVYGACAGQVVPATEICNGVDDNCNGMVDEGVTQSCYTGPAGTSGVGACRAGTQTCTGGTFGACVGQVVPAAETCNNVDDNCNGMVDESVTRSCYTGPAGTSGVGVCRNGTQTCTAGVFSATCSGQVVPSTELCNNVDDNCNGTIDESITQSCYTGPAGTSGVGPCHGGTQTCSAGAFSACSGQVTPNTELCNNMDDDCNGVIDNNTTIACYTGPAGTVGVGTCRAGTQTCSGGMYGVCTGDVGPTTETCNNLDDNCNGMTDEGLTQACYTGPAGTQGVGACRGGTQTCVAGAYGTCAGQVVPGVETCNGVDDDCDGFIDDGTTLCAAGQTCAGATCVTGYRSYTVTSVATAFVNACTQSGAVTVLPTTDDGTAPLTLPFNFRLYGYLGTAAWVSSNGAVGIGSVADTSYSNSCLPYQYAPHNAILPYWDDLMTRAGGICYATLGAAPSRRFVITLNNEAHCCTDVATDQLTASIILYEGSNLIDVVYSALNGANNGSSATIGVVNDTGSNATQSSCNATITAPSAIRFTGM